MLDINSRTVLQARLEAVYDRHRIWPAANTTPKPAFNPHDPATKAMLHHKVSQYMGQSNALDHAGIGITPEQLQGEIDRMIATTQDPAMLQELFNALYMDPFLIAETLALPNLTRNLYPAAFAAGLVTGPANSLNPDALAPANRPVYTLNPLNLSSCSAWSPIRNGPPDARTLHTTVWTGTEMIVWGGNPSSSGSRYNPAIDNWIPTSEINAPSARMGHTAIWTGTEMIVWGGVSGSVFYNSGGRYNPVTDSWNANATSTVNAPTARSSHTAVWSGTEMIIWGCFNTGGRYNPSTDSWIATSMDNVPAQRGCHTAVWTGTEMIVWGGSGGSGIFNTGGRYNPATDSWLPTRPSTTADCGNPTDNVPTCRQQHSAVWTGSEMIIWGGAFQYSPYAYNTGGRYNPGTNTWLPTSIGADVPDLRSVHTAIWTGTEMIVWGGVSGFGGIRFDTGGRYNPGTDSWQPTPTGYPNPTGRSQHTAIWTGSEMIVWGGDNLVKTGGRYRPSSDSWRATYDGANVPTPRSGHTAVWTGAEMIVWSGSSGTPAPAQTGGRYYPAINDWLTTNQTNCSPANNCLPSTTSGGHTAIWNGSRMLIWGGLRPDRNLDLISVATGGQYNPANDQWDRPITLQNPIGCELSIFAINL